MECFYSEVDSKTLAQLTTEKVKTNNTIWWRFVEYNEKVTIHVLVTSLDKHYNGGSIIQNTFQNLFFIELRPEECQELVLWKV